MSTHQLKIKTFCLVLTSLLWHGTLFAQEANESAETPQPILLTEPKEPLEDRLQRKITLDVRDMNVVDVIKFLAQKGDFNVIISPSVDGRTTVLLHSVIIQDALDIVASSNKLAYNVDNDIIQVMSGAEYEALYGKQFNDRSEVAVIHLQYSKPSYVLAALDNMKSNIGKIIIDEDTGSVVLVDTPQSIELMKQAILQIEQPLETIIYKLKYARAEVVTEKLRARIDAKAVGSISADERSNQVMIRALPGRREEIQKILRTLDKATQEVLIEARILQIIIKPNFDTGIDWNALVNNKGKNKFNITTVLDNSNISSNFGQIGVGDISTSDFSAAIKNLQQVSDTKILSSPQILVSNNEEAKIHIGDTVPYIVTTTNGSGTTAVTSEDVRFIDVGLKLDVTPTINKDGMVTMRLRPEISSVVAKVSSQGGGIPQVNKTEVETSLMVQDGSTIIMAGLKKEEKTHSKKGIPGLMNVPYLGNLFSSTADAITATEIVILITPHVIKGTDTYNKNRGTIKPPKAYNGNVQMKSPENKQ